MVGREQIRAYKEYVAALNTDLQYSECTAEGNTVTCQLTKDDDMLRKVAAGPVSHSMLFTFEGGLIQKQAVTTPPESAKVLGQTSGAFLGWVKENHPEAMAQLFTPAGQFVYSGENGTLVASLIQEWNPAVLPASGGTDPTAALLPWLGVGGLLLLALGLWLRRKSSRVMLVLPALIAAVLLVAGPVAAQATATEVTGWVESCEYSDPGHWTYPGGNIHIRGMVRICRERGHPYLEGVNTTVVNANYDSQGSGPVFGTFHRVTDEGGEWEGTFSGVRTTDGDAVVHAVGHGRGMYEGLQIMVTLENGLLTARILDPHGE
jgi:hypothetical protein